jgi:hypothetical protein
MDKAENEVHDASYEILSVGTDAGILCNVRKIQTEGAVMKPATPKTERPPSTQLRKIVFGGSLNSIETPVFLAQNAAPTAALCFQDRMKMIRFLSMPGRSGAQTSSFR